MTNARWDLEKYETFKRVGSPALSEAPAGPAPFGIRDLLAAARRRLWVVALCCVAAIAVALAYLATAAPLYRAEARIIVEPNVTSVAQDILSSPAEVPKAELVDSQVEILKADDTALQVVRSLGLAEDPEFVSADGGPVALILGHVRELLGRDGSTAGAEEAELTPEEAALASVRKGLDVTRVGDTLVLEIGFTSQEPEKAARIATTFVDVFMSGQDEARLAEARRNTAWLKERSDELLQQYLDADRRLTDERARAVGNDQVGQTRALVNALEQEVETYKALHQTFVERYTRSLDWGSYPLMETRIVSAARPPASPANPNKPLALALALVLGGIAGTAIAILLECSDRSLRTGDGVRRALGLPYVGLVPEIRARGAKLYGHASAAPFSAFAEALRSVKVAVDSGLPDRGPRVIGIVSALPGEGKSVIAGNLARLLHDGGARTLLIDADLRNAALSRTMAGDGSGIVTALAPAAGAPAAGSPAPRAPEGNGDLMATGPALRALIAEARGRSDYVIVDLPSVGLISDAEAVAEAFDGFVLVVRWGSTPAPVVRAALLRNAGIARRCVGVLLNRAALPRVRLYDNGESPDSYFGRHAAYFRG